MKSFNMNKQYIHHKTNNQSALKLAKIYKEFGIKKYWFPLVIYDDGLQYINPLSDTISEEYKIRVILEMMRNPWYFFREIVRINESGDKTRMELHRGNTPALWLLLHSKKVVLQLPRQRFKTMSIMILLCYLLYFGTRNTKMMLFGNSNTLLVDNIEKVRLIRDSFPLYLKDEINKSYEAGVYTKKTFRKKSKDNTEAISYDTLGNGLNKRSPAITAFESNNVGRGTTTPIQYFDEVAHTKHMDILFKAAAPAYSGISKKAKMNNSITFQVFTSTEGFLNTDEGKWFVQVKENCCTFDEKMYDMNTVELDQFITFNSLNDMVLVKYMYYDTNVEDDYYAKQCRELHNDQDAIDREILNKPKAADSNHPLGQNKVSLLFDKRKKPIYSIKINKVFILNLYRKEEDIDFDIPYLIGLDPSGNLQKDFSALVVLDPRNCEVVAVMRCNSQNTSYFSLTVAQIMTNIFKKSILICERNGIGITFLDNIIRNNSDLISRIYHEYKRDNNGNVIRITPGLYSTSNTRNLIYRDVLSYVVDNFSDNIHDENIINEISSLTMIGDRVDHGKGFHDDTLMAMLFTFFFLKHISMEDKMRYLNTNIIFQFYNQKMEENKMKNKEIKTFSDFVEKKKNERLNIPLISQEEIKIEKPKKIDFYNTYSEETLGLIDVYMKKREDEQKKIESNLIDVNKEAKEINIEKIDNKNEENNKK